MKKTGRLVLLAVVLILVGVAAVAFTAPPIPERSEFGPPIAELRALATSTGEPLPTQLRSLKLGESFLPELAVVAGRGFAQHQFLLQAHQVVYEDGLTVILDTGGDEKTLVANMPSSKLYEGRFAQLEEAMRKADAIAITHEHFDHSSGIAHSPYFNEIASHVVMTDEQLHGPGAEQAGFTAQEVQRLTPLRYERTHLLRPGIVLLRAPGHTPGTQMIYVRLASGKELLLVGDIAWHADNFTLPRAHPRLVDWIGHMDGAAVASQLRYLHELHAAEPTVNIVVAHDGAQLADLLQRGLIQDGFL